MLIQILIILGRLVEVYFGFQKINEVNLSYVDIRTGIDEWFQDMYMEVLALAEKVGSTEQRPRVCGRQTQRNNCPSESVAEYFKRTVAIPFLDVICSEMKSRFSQDKRAHYELCALVPEVIVKKSIAEVKELGQSLLVKWNHVMPLPSAFQSELQRWINYWKRQLPISSSSVTSLLAFHADATFFPNLRELLEILSVLPLGSVEAERSFSCLRRIHNWLRNTLATEKLSDLAVIAMHGHEVPISKVDICKRYMDKHPRRMMASSLFDDGD